jgi:hypothetical protein
MKVWLAIVLGCSMLPAGPAVAGPWRELPSVQGQARPERPERGSQRQQDPSQPERPQRQQRMSDDERRELHRDLDKARREIYQPRRER